MLAFRQLGREIRKWGNNFIMTWWVIFLYPDDAFLA